MTLEVLTHNDQNISANGTCLRGYLDGPGNKIVEQFGEPLLGYPDDKVEFEWILLVDDEPVTIYAWKNYGEKSFGEISRWNVGGKSKRAVELLSDLGFSTSNSSW